MVYRLLCCSDSHGDPPPHADEREVVVWLHGGDLVDGSRVGRAGTTWQAAARVWNEWAAARTVPVLLTPGNHDTPAFRQHLLRLRDISGGVHRIAANLLIAGIGWSGERFYELPLEADLDAVCDQVRRHIRRERRADDHVALLTHYPPHANDPWPAAPSALPNRGTFRCVTALVAEIAPVAVVQGHVHDWFGMHRRCEFGGHRSLVINPGPRGCKLLVDAATGQASVEAL
ncbi:MAG: metallophosphoesterase [Phycisphaeraceae bacterium]|nr:metallophosphoesterase [Phycisphaeraceae bacterium]